MAGARRARRAPAKEPASGIFPPAQTDHKALHELLAFTRGPLMDTVEDLENQREEARAILREWAGRGESGKWMHNHYISRLMIALGMQL